MLDYIYDDVNSWDIVDEMLDDETFDDETYFESFLTEPESDADYILPQ